MMVLIPAVLLPPLEFPDPENLTEEELGDLLSKKIEELAERRIFLQQTNHLTDRELYEELCTPEMQELIFKNMPDPALKYDRSMRIES